MAAQEREQPGGETRPQKTGIWIGVGLVVLAAIAFPVLLAIGLTGLYDDLANYDRVEAGSSAVVDVDAGTYMIFTEVSTSPSFNVVGPKGPMLFTAPDNETSFTTDGSEWTSALLFDVDEAGQIEVTNQGPGRVAVGPPFGGRLAKAIVVPLVVGALLGVPGLILLIAALRRRKKAKDQIESTQGRSSSSAPPAR